MNSLSAPTLPFFQHPQKDAQKRSSLCPGIASVVLQLEADLLEGLLLGYPRADLQDHALVLLVQVLHHLGRGRVALLEDGDQARLDVDILQRDHLSFGPRVALEHEALHLCVDLGESALDEAVHDGVLDEGLPPDVVEHQSAHLAVLGDLVAELLPGLGEHEPVPPRQLLADVHALVLLAAEHQDAGGALGPLGLDLELEQPGDVLEDVFAAADGAVDFEVVVGVDVLDLLDVEEVVLGVVLDVDRPAGDDGPVEVLLVGLELFPG